MMEKPDQLRSKNLKKLIATIFCLCPVIAFASPVSVTNAWVAATAPGQEEGAAYMDLSSDEGANLVEAQSPVADMVDVHSMTMKKGVMEMRLVKVLEIPAKGRVTLAPGKMHLMLMDVKKQLVPGDHVPIRLTFEHEGKRYTVDVDAKVMSMTHHMDMH